MSLNIVTFAEAESIIENLKAFNIEEIGSSEWLKHHDNIEKLNMQAILSAQEQDNEFIRDVFLSNNNILLLVCDLLALDVWKSCIFKKISFECRNSINLYMTNYHEATLVNLFETLMYHGDIVEQMSKVLLDLVDYCYAKIKYWSTCEPREVEKLVLFYIKHKNVEDESSFYTRRIDFEVTLKCITIIRYIVDNLKRLDGSVSHRIYNIHDFPLLLIQMVENPPWKCFHDEKLYKYMNSSWETVSKSQDRNLSKIEGQVWICLYQMLIIDTKKYAINEYKKDIILKLRGYLNSNMISQIPALGHMEEYLDRLSIANPPVETPSFFIEQLPEIRDKFKQSIKCKIEMIAKHQSDNFFSQTQDDGKIVDSLAKTYDIENISKLIPDFSQCSYCGNKSATKKCASCKVEYYCSRTCQASDWKRHKKLCKELASKLDKKVTNCNEVDKNCTNKIY